jgi:hypothetical protein
MFGALPRPNPSMLRTLLGKLWIARSEPAAGKSPILKSEKYQSVRSFDNSGAKFFPSFFQTFPWRHREISRGYGQKVWKMRFFRTSGLFAADLAATCPLLRSREHAAQKGNGPENYFSKTEFLWRGAAAERTMASAGANRHDNGALGAAWRSNEALVARNGARNRLKVTGKTGGHG